MFKVGQHVNSGGDKGVVTVSGIVHRGGQPVPQIQVFFPLFKQTVKFEGNQMMRIQPIEA